MSFEDTKPIILSKPAKVTTKKLKDKTKLDADFKPKKGTQYKKASEWLQCPQCDEKFYSENVLQKHLFIKHNYKDENSSLVECPYCDSSRCVTKKSLPTHIQLFHPEKALNKFRCDLCPKEKVMGRTEVANALHKALVHPTVDPNDSEKIFCQICEDPKESFTKSKMESHIKLTHFTADLPQCEFCGKHFLSPYLLTRHVEQCHLLEG